MNSVLTVLMFASSLLLLTGCIPTLQTYRPEVSGTVVEANGGEPLKDVHILGDMRTGDDGKFTIPAKEHLVFMLPVGGVFPIVRSFTLDKEGYRSRHCECMALTVSPKCTTRTITLLKENEFAGKTAEAERPHEPIPDGTIQCDPLPVHKSLGPILPRHIIDLSNLKHLGL